MAYERVRVGQRERRRAVRMLGEHLAAGRLGVEVHGDRVEAGVRAEYAYELDALFVDLPAPHPPAPGVASDLRRAAVVAPLIVALLVLVTGSAWWWFALGPAVAVLFWPFRRR